MPLEINDTLTTEKNKKENTPIMLYAVSGSPLPGGTVVRAAEWETDVVYGGQTYIATPVKHDGISKNIMGEIDSVKVTWSNINREIGAILLAYNGLRGCKVDLILVFLDSLDDAEANITETFWIDSASITDTEATFILTSRIDLYSLKIPCRTMDRDFCGWVYKERGCWLTGEASYEAPAGFANEGVTCDHTIDGPKGCAYHNNKKRFGGFPSIPRQNIWVL